MSETPPASEELVDPNAIGVPGPVFAAGIMAAMALLMWVSGAYSPDRVPEYADSRRQITGMALMLTLLPTYFPLATWLAQRRSLALLAELRPRLGDPSIAVTAAESIRTALRRNWMMGLPFGIGLGLLNTNPLEAVRDPAPLLASAISAGQLVMWALIGLFAAVRLPATRAFRALAEIIPLDLLRPERQRLISHSGLTDIAIIAGALLITPLQSLDLGFRWYNYRFGLLVALPAAVFFLLWPLLPLYRRNRAERHARLAEVDRQLADLAPRTPATPRDSAHLEMLLAHRDRIQSAHAWPLSMRLVSRVVLYMVFPPLAWAGAALVERGIDWILG